MRLLLVERARVAEEVTREIMNNSRAFAVWLLVSLNTCIEGMRVVNGGVRKRGVLLVEGNSQTATGVTWATFPTSSSACMIRFMRATGKCVFISIPMLGPKPLFDLVGGMLLCGIDSCLMGFDDMRWLEGGIDE